nr:GNAT family N-acetyltransferase [Natronocella acetinitrilica]
MTRLRWDIFTVCDTVAEIGEAPWECVPQTTYLRRKREQGVVVTVDGEFTQWLQALGPNTRLKVYNRRNYLEQTGRHAVYREESNAGQALELLNHFHMQRWGKPAFEGASLRFHQRLLERLGGTGKAHCTVLEVDGQAESLLYDVIAGSCAYNLQAGFNEQFDSKVSLGTLHLGYTLEDAFANTAVTKYDLLAGSGKNTFYKRHFRGQVIEFDTWQLARHPLLRMGYGAYRLLPGVLQRVVVRLLRPGRDSHEAQA